MKQILILLGGEINADFALRLYKENNFERIIAADGGLCAADCAGICPTDIVGDFDTVSKDLLSKYSQRKEIHIRRFQPEKDATDSQIAMELALSIGKDCEITVLGATGTRMDHALANIQLLAMPLSAGVSCRIVDENNRICLIKADTRIEKASQYGNYVSLLPFTERVEGITLEGFKYPLSGHTMDIRTNYTLGISNELVKESGWIRLYRGILILIESKDR